MCKVSFDLVEVEDVTLRYSDTKYDKLARAFGALDPDGPKGLLIPLNGERYNLVYQRVHAALARRFPGKLVVRTRRCEDGALLITRHKPAGRGRR